MQNLPQEDEDDLFRQWMTWSLLCPGLRSKGFAFGTILLKVPEANRYSAKTHPAISLSCFNLPRNALPLLAHSSRLHNRPGCLGLLRIPFRRNYRHANESGGRSTAFSFRLVNLVADGWRALFQLLRVRLPTTRRQKNQGKKSRDSLPILIDK